MYLATENAIKRLNENKITQIAVEKDLKDSLNKGFTLNKLLTIDVKIDEKGNRYLISAVDDDYDESGNIAEKYLYEVGFDGQWYKKGKK